jgi:HEAT repeat protein
MNLIRRNTAGSKLDEIERIADGKPRPLARLLKLSRDSDAEIRWRAFELLAESKDPRVTKRFADGLSDPDEIVRLECIDALADTRDRSVVPLLRSKLEDPDALVRREAALALGRIGDIDSVPVLEKRASHATRTEKVGIYAGLICLGRQQYLSSLLGLMAGTDYHVRSAVANTLVGMVDVLSPKARALVVAKLKSTLAREETIAVRTSIEEALRSIADIPKAQQHR